MANYTTADIKALRESTGAGMMDVKRALDEAEGDSAKAVEILRVRGLKGVTKREGRAASNGLVCAQVTDGAGTLGPAQDGEGLSRRQSHARLDDAGLASRQSGNARRVDRLPGRGD